MKMLKKAMLAATVAVATTAWMAPAQAAAMRGWNIHVEGYPNTVAMDKFAEIINEKSGGDISLQMFHGGVLGNQSDAIEQVRIGGLEVANFNLGPIGPIVPEANVVSLPFIFKDVDHMFRVLNGEAGDKINEGMKAKGLVSLAWFNAGARSFYNGKRAVAAPADVEGMKVRVMNNDLYSGMISALGGNPSPIAFSEVYQSLKTGVVDGAENNWPSYESTGHFEVAGFYSLSQHLIIPECLCMNAAAFDALSADDQAMVKAAAAEAAELQNDLWNKREQASQEKVEAAGVKVNSIEDKSAFQAAMEPVYANYLEANPDLRPLVELIQNTD